MSNCKCVEDGKIPKWALLTEPKGKVKSVPASNFFGALPKNQKLSKQNA